MFIEFQDQLINTGHIVNIKRDFLPALKIFAFTINDGVLTESFKDINSRDARYNELKELLLAGKTKDVEIELSEFPVSAIRVGDPIWISVKVETIDLKDEIRPVKVSLPHDRGDLWLSSIDKIRVVKP
jgi:hypothetical protein